MRIHRLTRMSALMAATALIAVGVAFQCAAGTLEIKVSDERGEPISQVAVYATPVAGPSVKKPTVAKRTASMDQKHNEFVPHVLVISAGTEVQFPNSDIVSHHVYSFSQAKTFELALYKGNTHPPLAFDEPGVVVLGCNIHDSMIGYIVVVPTEHFALSDERGTVRLEGLPAGDYTVEVWTPRARPMGLPAAQRVTVADGVAKLDTRITGRLAPEQDHKHGSTSLSWDRY
jgi:plastocyanin